MSYSESEKYYRSLNAYVKKLETPRLILLRKALVADARDAGISDAGKPLKSQSTK